MTVIERVTAREILDSRGNPTLEVEGGTGRPLGTRGEEEYSAGYFYPVERGGKRSKRLHVAELSIVLAQAEVDERARQLAYDIKAKAVEVLSNREKAAALNRLIEMTGEAQRLTEGRVKEGDAARLGSSYPGSGH